jgi:hypothetical protein
VIRFTDRQLGDDPGYVIAALEAVLARRGVGAVK